MRNWLSCAKLIGCGAVIVLLLTGCFGRYEAGDGKKAPRNEKTVKPPATAEQAAAEPTIAAQQSPTEQALMEQAVTETEQARDGQPAAEPIQQPEAEPETIEKDWSAYFDGLSGAAVVYDPAALRFEVYNEELARTRRSPCSTFKIISSLTALETGIIEPGDSVRRWSGEVFWNEKWNRDIDFPEAFRESCVWYFREVIDEIGPERMQEELERLAYGNGDLSDWEGRQNTNNNNRALTGFWVESSLMISPREQTEVMERIFGKKSPYSQETQSRLREVMLVEGQTQTDFSVYGKTGMGKLAGEVVDAWFVGFAQSEGKTVYFCVYLGQTEEKEVTSARAKEIAIRLVSDYLVNCNDCIKAAVD